MIWLLLSVLAMLGLALVARWGETAGQDRIMMMAWNYAVASLLTGTMAWAAGPAKPDGFTLALGALTGLSYAAALLFWMIAIPLAGLGVSTTAMRVSVVWPTLISVAFFGEVPSARQVTGIVVALVAIGLLLRAAGGTAGRLNRRSLGWLAALWISTGANAVLLKIFTEMGPAIEKPVFLALIFVFAGVICWVIVAVRRPVFRWGDLMRGGLFGVGNVAGNALLLEALGEVPAVVVFPVRDAAIIALVSLTGILLFRERPGPWGYAAIATAGLAVAFMSL